MPQEPPRKVSPTNVVGGQFQVVLCSQTQKALPLGGPPAHTGFPLCVLAPCQGP